MPHDHPEEEREGLEGRDYVFRMSTIEALPGPLRRVAWDLTYDEAHAALLGLVGTLAGAGWAAGFRVEAATFTVAALGIAFGLKRLPDDAPIAGRILRREPWYFTTVYTASAVLTAGVM